MIDREKVIEAFDEVKELVWLDDDEYTVGYNDGLEAGKNIAIALLKEQEAVKPKFKERMGGFVAGLCPTCGTALNNVLNVKACGKCGQAVKWE